MKRAHGEGGIDERGENVFRLRWRANGKRHAKTFRGSKAEARKELRALTNAVDTDSASSDSSGSGSNNNSATGAGGAPGKPGMKMNLKLDLKRMMIKARVEDLNKARRLCS